MSGILEIRNNNLILPLRVLRIELGLASTYFGLLLGIKAADVLNQPQITGTVFALLCFLIQLDLLRSGGHSKTQGLRLTAQLILMIIISCMAGALLYSFNEAFFFTVESHFRVIQYGDGLTNWVLLSVLLVISNLTGSLSSRRRSDIAWYSRLFPAIALGLVYLKGIIS